MVVLNIYSKISTICISKKLGLYIGNLPKERGNDWSIRLFDIMYKSKKQIIENQKNMKINKDFNIFDFARTVLPNEKLNNIS